jgi:hypothetical protein
VDRQGGQHTQHGHAGQRDDDSHPGGMNCSFLGFPIWYFQTVADHEQIKPGNANS